MNEEGSGEVLNSEPPKGILSRVVKWVKPGPTDPVVAMAEKTAARIDRAQLDADKRVARVESTVVRAEKAVGSLPQEPDPLLEEVERRLAELKRNPNS